MTLYRRARRFAVPALTLAVALAGCGGSGSSDKDKIKSIVKAEGQNPAAICDHASPKLLAQLGGAAACKQKAAAQKPDPSVHITRLTIKQHRATAVIVDKSGTNSVIFEKQGGDWLLAG